MTIPRDTIHDGDMICGGINAIIEHCRQTPAQRFVMYFLRQGETPAAARSMAACQVNALGT